MSSEQRVSASAGTDQGFSQLTTELGALVASMLASDHPDALPGAADVTALMVTAVRLYAAAAEHAPDAPAPAQLDLTPTEACTAAAALLKSQLLTPFEFAIWFSEKGA